MCKPHRRAAAPSHCTPACSQLDQRIIIIWCRRHSSRAERHSSGNAALGGCVARAAAEWWMQQTWWLAMPVGWTAGVPHTACKITYKQPCHARREPGIRLLCRLCPCGAMTTTTQGNAPDRTCSVPHRLSVAIFICLHVLSTPIGAYGGAWCTSAVAAHPHAGMVGPPARVHAVDWTRYVIQKCTRNNDVCFDTCSNGCTACGVAPAVAAASVVTATRVATTYWCERCAASSGAATARACISASCSRL